MNIPSADVIERVQKRYLLDPKRVSRALGILERDEIELLPSGNYSVRSHSKGAPVTYSINPQYESCNCIDAKDWYDNGVLVRRGNVCKHLCALLLLREMQRDEQFARARETALLTQVPQVAIIVRDPIADREHLYKSAQPARTEWTEELEAA